MNKFIHDLWGSDVDSAVQHPAHAPRGTALQRLPRRYYSHPAFPAAQESHAVTGMAFGGFAVPHLVLEQGQEQVCIPRTPFHRPQCPQQQQQQHQD